MAADDDNDPSGDFIPTAHKLEFSKYDGTGDPLLWLNRCDRYFRVRLAGEHTVWVTVNRQPDR
jgi:hypothetical protein